MNKSFVVVILIIFCLVSGVLNIWQAYRLNVLSNEVVSSLQTASALKRKLKESEHSLSILSEKKEEHPIEKKVQNCMKEKHYTTVGMSQCVNESVSDWNNEIDRVMLLFQSKLTKEQYTLLQSSQSQWVKYKNAEWLALNSILNSKSGTIYTNILSGFKADVVEQRARDISELYNILFDNE